MKHIPVSIICRILFLFSFMLATLHGFGQYENHLILKKNSWKNKVHYLTGDEIIFQRKGSDNMEVGIIQGIVPGQLIIGGRSVPVNEIVQVIRIRNGFAFKSGGKTLQIAAPGFLFICAFNALIWNIRPVWSTGNLVTAGSLLTAGLILPLFQERHFSIGKKFSLKVVQSDPKDQ